MRNVFIEPFINSFWILIFGFITIPIVIDAAGAQISAMQGAKASLIFFVLRYFGMLPVRIYFWRKNETIRR